MPSNRPSLAIGMRILDLPNVRQAFGALDALIRDGTPFELRRVEFVSIFRRQIVVNVVARPIRSPSGDQSGSVIMVVDATREVALEQQVVDMGRADLFASLVGRIAHDLNNALVGVKGHASILGQRTGADTDADAAYRHTARQLMDATDRLSVVVDGLLALVKRGNPAEQSPIDAVELLRGCEDLLRSVLPPQVTLHLHAPTGGTPSGVLPCRIGEAQLRQVLLNLCAHARDNISNWGDGRPGRIEVRLERRAEPIACVAIVVRDDCRPATPELLGRLFE